MRHVKLSFGSATQHWMRIFGRNSFENRFRLEWNAMRLISSCHAIQLKLHNDHRTIDSDRLIFINICFLLRKFHHHKKWVFSSLISFYIYSSIFFLSSLPLMLLQRLLPFYFAMGCMANGLFSQLSRIYAEKKKVIPSLKSSSQCTAFKSQASASVHRARSRYQCVGRSVGRSVATNTKSGK